MKNILLTLVFGLWLADAGAQNRRFFDKKRRDCLQMGLQYYTPNAADEYGAPVISMLYSHDFLQKSNGFLRGRAGIDCFVEYGFHLQTGLLVGGRADFLEYSIGPVMHSGTYFWELNNIAGTSQNQYFQLGLNATVSATFAKRIVLGYEWQGFRTESSSFLGGGFSPDTKKILAKSHALRLGFWF